MNQPVSMSATHSPKKWWRIIFASSYNLANVASLILCFHLAAIIRSDGPSGFGELIIKSWILLLSLTSFCAGAILSFKQYRAIKPRPIYFLIGFLISMLLAFFAILGVIEACSDSKGYCRNWQIAAVAPNIAFEADGYAAAQFKR